MKKTPQVLWAEGMFLRPHHLQTAERYREEALQREIQRIQPFYFGLQSLDVAPDQLENFVFEIRDVSLKLKDGTALSSDSTLRLSPRSFKNELDKAGGRMRVFVGVPVMRENAPNTFAPGEGPAGVDRRYVAENAEALDENTGSNPQPVGVRRCNGKLFFGAESQEGYECLEVAVVERSGSGRNFPVLSREFIPSLTELGASRTIQALCDGVTNRIEAKHRLLLTDVAQGRLAITSDGTSGWQAIIKLQILGSFLFLFQQLTKIPRIHPFHVYTEFARLAGELSIFDDGKVPVRIPVYDHEKLGPCFHETCRVIEALLEKIVA
ncbi:MAG TPA: type VI secretion system baseplate subunit TssK, partial [Thermoanaerobaculia bacterium]|nr:type VI secretion system baseplate subunit TssK [Thermoanaerobaculia bacterium]